MRIISYILTPIKLTARLSCSTSNRRYTSLVQILQDKHRNRNLLCNELSVKRFNGTNKTNSENENVALEKNLENTTILPIALLYLSPVSKKSSKVLLIPLNLHEADEQAMRSTLTSIFSKPKSLKKIEAFSQALKEVQSYKKFGKQTQIRKEEHQDVLNAQKELKFSLKELQLAENSNSEQQAISKDSFSRALNKSLSQCYLHSKQMFAVNAAKFSSQNSENIDLIEKVNKAELLNPTSVMKIDASKLNLKEISWYKNIPFFEVQSYSFPLTLAKKSFSTSAKALTQNAFTHDKYHNKSLAHEIIYENSRRFASSISSGSKCNPNYDYPFLTKLFDTKDLLMSSNAYSQALVEAAKRRAALAESKTEDKQLKTDVNSRPIVKGIKGCDVPESQHTNEPAIKSPKPCPPPSKPKMTASNGCKKDNPCKSPECSEPCKNELEKLKQQSEENMKKQKNKMPTGCESPKCKKDNNCTKLPKSPCKKASNQQLQSEFQSPSNPSAAIKQMKDTCKKDDPCKTPECPNPCKEEMEKLKRQTEEDIARKRNKSPTGCVSPKCKKEDACTKRKDSPCKKASNNQPIAFQQTLNCNKKVDANKAKDQKQKNPCLDEHKEYKPKCNTDPCKQDKSPCGGGAKKEPTKQPADKKADSCGKGQQKENPCKTKEQGGGSKQKEEPCNKKENNPCGSKKDDSSGCGKKENPCKKDNKKEESCGKKKEPCGGSKQKEEPCNKKENNPCGSKKDDSSGCGKKENPCKKDNKKEESCGKKKEQGGGCKQKEEPCNKKENNPCGSKKDDSSGCGKKENPCKKDNKKEESCGKKKEPCGGSKQKEEPCNKKENNPCGSKKDDSSGCGKKETPCIKDNKKEESCGKKKAPCGGSKQKKEPCKKKESPCKKKETPCKKEDPCNKKSSGPCGSRKEDPCKKNNEDPCGKSKKPDSCKKEKDSCKKNKEPSKSPCTNKKEEPCKKEKEDPCKNKKSGPCVSNEKKDSCTKKPTSPCEPKNDNKTECQKASSSTSTGSSTKQACGTPKKETKPNCGKSNRSLSSSVATTKNNRYFSLNKRNFNTNKNLCQFDFMRRFSSKRTNNNNSDDLGRTSKCKSIEIKVPPKRKPAYNPHPKDGLRKCYPTYDMDCTKFCKDARKTDCKKYDFLKDTDGNERKS